MSQAVDWLYGRGHAADLILAILLLELIGLTRFAGWPFWPALLRLLPGALMIVALRAALTGADWYWVALALLLSFPAHLADLAHRPK